MKTYRNGSSAAAWYFSSSDGGQPVRYDLPRPNGSCYFADDPAGAWLEVFRGQQVVPRQDIAVRSMVTAARTGDVLALADLEGGAASIARRLGVRVASIPFDIPTTTPPPPGRR